MPTIWTMDIPGWTPTPLNKLLGSHWAKAGRLKDHDKEIIGRAVKAYGIPTAEERRSVSMLIIHPPGKRFCDKDSQWKSTLDALVHHGAIKNDSHAWVSCEPVEFARGEKLRTIITIQE